LSIGPQKIGEQKVPIFVGFGIGESIPSTPLNGSLWNFKT